MSRWDADLQQWVEDDPPGRGPRADDEPYDGEETEVRLLPGPPDGLPEGPSHAAILAGALAGVVLAGGLGVGAWAMLRDDGTDTGGRGGPSPGPSVSGLPTPGPSFSYDGSSTSGTTTGTTGTTGSTGMTGSSGSMGTTGSTGTTTGGFSGGFPGGYSTSPPVTPFLGSAASAPAGFERTRDAAGFRADVPSGWERSEEGASVFFKQADGNSLIQVFTLTGPEPTPYASLEETERTVARNKATASCG
ncbi:MULTISPECIES: hypothetical protein [Streptomyces]|uniref:hypothetical protein n=1 Tax=Streptomyces TaxID=1883 RepID=UPI00345B696E